MSHGIFCKLEGMCHQKLWEAELNKTVPAQAIWGVWFFEMAEWGKTVKAVVGKPSYAPTFPQLDGIHDFHPYEREMVEWQRNHTDNNKTGKAHFPLQINANEYSHQFLIRLVLIWLVGKVWHIHIFEPWTVFDNDVTDGKGHNVLLHCFF